MTVTVQCPNPKCGSSIGVAEADLPRLGPCPTCGTSLRPTEPDGSASNPGQFTAPAPTTRVSHGGTTGSAWASAPSSTPSSGRAQAWDFPEGTLFADRFAIVKRLGQGGMGEVYRATDSKLPRDVAIKVPLAHIHNDEDFRRRFQREAHAVARLRHPGICQIFDVGEWQGRSFIVMEYLDGASLQDIYRERAEPFEPAAAAKLVREVAEAVHAAHVAEIIHRDLKPENIMIGRDSRITVMDFGLAKAVEQDGDALTSVGRVMGTPPYMPIEQFRDAGSVDHRGDIYSLGVIFYQLLTDRMPYPGRSMSSVLSALIETKAVPPSTLRGGLTPELDAIVMKAMAKDAGDRYPSMTDLIGAIDAFLVRPSVVLATPPSFPPRPTPAPVDPGPTVDHRRAETLQEIPPPLKKGSGRGMVAGLLLAFAAIAGIVAAVVIRRPGDHSDRRFQFGGVKAGQERSDNGPRLGLCWCPPAQFPMGSPLDEKDRKADEGPKPITLARGFWIGKFEVTQAQYDLVMDANPSRFAATGKLKDRVVGVETSAFPVESITWEQANEFCDRMTALERKAGRLPVTWKFALPTEAQWEYACRAGTTDATAFGPSLGASQANFRGTHPYGGAEKGADLKRPAAVGAYPANAWGLHDMHGNVEEWCGVAYVKDLPGGIDPAPPSSWDTYPVIRGGNWESAGKDCRSASRATSIHRSAATLGFRVVAVRE